MNRIEALNVVIGLLDNYLTGSPDTLPEYEEAYEVLLRMRDGIQKQALKKTKERMIWESFEIRFS